MNRNSRRILFAAVLGTVAAGALFKVADATEDAAAPELNQTRPDRYSEATYCEILDNQGSVVMVEVIEIEHYERTAGESGVPIMRRVEFAVTETYIGEAPTSFTQIFSGGTVGDTTWSNLGHGYRYPIKEGASFLLHLRFQANLGQPPRASGSQAIIYYMAEMPTVLPIDITPEAAEDIYSEHCDPNAPVGLTPTQPFHDLLPLGILDVCEHY